MGRPITDLSLPHFLKVALTENGYRSTDDLSVSATDLAIELRIGVPQAEDILRQADSFRAGTSRRPPSPPRASQLLSTTATELLQSQNRTRFSTFSTALDNLIWHFAPSAAEEIAPPLNLKGKARALIPGAGAITPGMVLEISGPPGGGKTSVALAVALSARMGDGGEEGEGKEKPQVLFIDTEGSVTPGRVKLALETFMEEAKTLLEGFHFIRVPTQIQMVGLMHTLDEWLEAHPKVKLVIIDTLSYHFRQPTLELAPRKRIMDIVKQVVGKAATVHGCAVIVTTQLATKLLTAENKPANFDTGDRAVLMPQLGDTWTTERTIRIAMFRGGVGDDLRYAHASTTVGLSSNPELQELPWASFDIDNVGLPCDVPPIPDDLPQ